MTKEQETRLQKLENEIKALREELAGAAEWPKKGDSYIYVQYSGFINDGIWTASDYERAVLYSGRIFPDTPEGREAAEWFSFCEGFRARWKRSADKTPTQTGYVPVINDNGYSTIYQLLWHYGLPKWSTEEACRAFVDSEGGPERFAEILKRGIL